MSRAYHGVQELIIQNFRAKPDTAMRGMPDAELDDLVAAVAVARLLLGPSACLQAPPNLVDAEYERLTAKGVAFRDKPKAMGPTKFADFDDTCGNLIRLVEG